MAAGFCKTLSFLVLRILSLLSPYVHSWFPSGNRVAEDAPLGAVWERWSVAKNDTGKSREGSVAYQPLEGIRVGLLAHVLLFWWGSSGQQGELWGCGLSRC